MGVSFAIGSDSFMVVYAFLIIGSILGSVSSIVVIALITATVSWITLNMMIVCVFVILFLIINIFKSNMYYVLCLRRLVI